MAKLLRTQGPEPGRHGIPQEARRIEIMLALLKLKHFKGIWYNGYTLGVRTVETGKPEYLSWSEAVELIEAAGETVSDRKPSAFQKTLRVVSIVVAK